MILHTVNKSPFQQTTLAQCLYRCGEHDAIILLEDGVYGALQSNPQADQLSAVKCFVIEADLQARGLLAKPLIEQVQLIDFDRFVTLSCHYSLVLSWY
jgi:tRNA 2-thiouridine synthesizing protein B